MNKAFALPLVCFLSLIISFGSLVIGAEFVKGDSFWLGVSEAVALHQSDSKLKVVDIRASSDFQNIHVSNSLNMPLFQIKTKGFLRARPILLITNGIPDKQIDQEVNDLNKRGFQIQILKGGIHAWREGKGPVEGINQNVDSIPGLAFEEISRLDFSIKWNLLALEELPMDEFPTIGPNDTNVIKAECFQEVEKEFSQTNQDQPFLLYGFSKEQKEKLIQMANDHSRMVVFIDPPKTASYPVIIQNMKIKKRHDSVRNLESGTKSSSSCGCKSKTHH